MLECMRRTSTFLSRSLSLLLLVSLSCGTFDSSNEETPPPPPPEDPSKPPEVIPGQRFQGIFVSSSRGANGIDGADGTEAKPFKTLKEGVLVAQQRGERLFVCAETFEESLELLDGVSAYGYLDCATSPWSKSAKRALVISQSNDPALLAKDLTKSARLEAFDFVGPDRLKALVGVISSSYGGIVRNVKDLTLVEVKLVGGAASNGIDGTPPKANSFTGNPNGQPPVQQTTCTGLSCSVTVGAVPGGAPGSITCAAGASNPGGAGGDGIILNQFGNKTGTHEPHGRPLVGNAQTAAGGSSKEGVAQNPPPGIGGALGANGAHGSNGVWSFTRDGFEPGNGTDGKPGATGQGGGGGGAGTCWYDTSSCDQSAVDKTGWKTARGGGGGAGGCGGLPGTAGKGGGASIGLFVVDSTVKLERVHLTGGPAGAAGKGNLGGPGLLGGTGGSYGVILNPELTAPWGGKGGDGGIGGTAGASGHGAPGPSIGLVYTGTRPSITDSTIVGGQAGAGAPQLLYGANVVIPAVNGESIAEHAF